MWLEDVKLDEVSFDDAFSIEDDFVNVLSLDNRLLLGARDGNAELVV